MTSANHRKGFYTAAQCTCSPPPYVRHWERCRAPETGKPPHLCTPKEVQGHGSPGVMHWQPSSATAGHGGQGTRPSPDEVHVAADDGTVAGILKGGWEVSGGGTLPMPQRSMPCTHPPIGSERPPSAPPPPTAPSPPTARPTTAPPNHGPFTPQCSASGRTSPPTLHC